MTRVALVLAYDGTDFFGWQDQRGQRTVQGEVERALATLLGARVPLVASGRTDAGVHASFQVAHVDVDETALAGFGSARELAFRLNPLLPDDVRVRGGCRMADAFHARKSATGKRYRFRLRLAPVDDPLTRRHRVHVAWPVDLVAMREAARRFVGRHDFAALQASGSSVKTTERELRRCELEGEPPEVDLVVEGDGFLRHMVRALAGSLLEVGRGRRDPEWVDVILGQRDRTRAGPNAPARGLTLERVRYADAVDGALLRAVAERSTRAERPTEETA